MAANKPARDVYQEVTDQIIASLEKGVAPWVMPWQKSLLNIPHKGPSKKPYRGINQILLMVAAMEHKYQHNDWWSYKQAQAAGGQVKKDESSTLVVYYPRLAYYEGKFLKRAEEKELIDAGLKDEITYRFTQPRFFPVFNRDQIEGLPALPERTVETSKDDQDIIAILRKMVKDHGIKFHMGSNQAAYSPGKDIIQMPRPSQFKDTGAYCSTLLHECGHWTGHESRLNREILNKFGTELYAKEELVAELSSAFVCAKLGIDGFIQHPEYIGNWLKVLQDDKKAIFEASSKAMKAADYLMKFEMAQEEEQVSEEKADIEVPVSEDTSDDEQPQLAVRI